jgi:hypothetical protein
MGAAPASADTVPSVAIGVVSGRGVPLPSITVTASCGGGSSGVCSTATTDSSGVATLANVPSATDVTVSASQGGQLYTWANLGTGSLSLDTTTTQAGTVTMADAHVVTGSFTGAGASTVRGLTALESKPTEFGIVNGYTEASITGSSFVLVDRQAPYIDEMPFYWVLGVGGLARYSGDTIDPGMSRPVTATSGLGISVPAPTSSVSGRFVDTAGRGIANAVVQTSTAGASDSSATTDSDGYFQLTGLWKGRYHPSLKNYNPVVEPAWVVVGEGQSADIGTVVVKKTVDYSSALGTVTGVVHDDELWQRAHGLADAAWWKKNVPAVHIVDQNGRDWTQKDASEKLRVKTTGILTARQKFTVKLPAGIYYLTPEGTTIRKKVVVRAGKTTKVKIVRPKTTGRITGTLLGSNGKPLKGGTVTLDGPGFFSVPTDSHGRFVSYDLIPGRYVVSAFPTGATEFSRPISTKTITIPAKAKTVKVKMKGKTKKTLKKVVKKITLRQPSLRTFSGTVTTADGTPLANVAVAVNRDRIAATRCEGQAISTTILDTVTGPDGQFTITVPLGSGVYYAAACPQLPKLDGLVATEAAYRIDLSQSISNAVLELH